MNCFATGFFPDDDAVNDWLKFYEMSAPLIAVGTFTSNDGVSLCL